MSNKIKYLANQEKNSFLILQKFPDEYNALGWLEQMVK